ncbi:MAG TPA: XRE family transcriptional regulator [Actinomycetota bacterium]|nr:XRE family transcriptional regulator [Actinomycetota bacterium]
MTNPPDLATVMAEVGPRLKRVREHRGATLAQLSAATGISKSTLSRLEAGQRKPSLELLLPIAQAHQVPLDELVGAPEIGDPRIPLGTPQVRRNGRTVYPLSRQPRDLHAWKVVIPPEPGPPELRTHEGYEWFYVLEGELRLIVANHDLVMHQDEVAEFETRFPHWFGSANGEPVAILSLLSQHGERTHGATSTARRGRGGG